MKALHDLDYQPDGALPAAALVQASNGLFYGTASNGGGSAGTVFIATSFGQYIPIYEFGFGDDGGSPALGPTVKTAE